MQSAVARRALHRDEGFRAMNQADPPFFTLCAADCLHVPANLPAFLLEQSCEQDLEQLERFGQIHPILTVPCASGQGMLAQSHCAYLLALKKAGISPVACRVISPESDTLSRFALRILHDQQELGSTVRQAYLLQEASTALSPEKLLVLLPLMGVKAQEHALKERFALLRLDAAVQRALHRQLLHTRCVPFVQRLPPAEQQELVALVAHYRLNGSKQQKLVELLVELQLRLGSGIATLLDQWRQEANPPRDNLPQEGQSLLDYLQQRYHPQAARAEERFREELRRLQAPAEVHITHTPAFEDEAVTVQLRYSDLATLQAHWPRLLKAVEKGNQAK